MTAKEANDKLYERMTAEQDKFRKWLLSQPPDEILNHAYEYSVREDVLASLEDVDLDGKDARALLKSPPLWRTSTRTGRSGTPPIWRIFEIPSWTGLV